MGALPVVHRSTRLPLIAVIAVFIITAAHLGIGRARNHQVGADDDRIWLYMTGANLGQSGRADDLQVRVSAVKRASGTPASDTIRIEMRRAYQQNYIGASAIYRAAAEAVERWSAGPASYPSFLAWALYAGFVAAYVVTCAAVVLAAAATGSSRVAAAMAVSIVLTSALEATIAVFGDPVVGGPTLLPRVGIPVEAPTQRFLATALGTIVNPGVAFTIFGDTPRNHFLLATIAVFGLRWANRHGLAAMVLLALSFLHQSQTGLLFVVLLGCDLILRPEVFRRPFVGLAATATLASFLFRERLGPYIGFDNRLLFAVAVAAVAGSVIAAAGYLASRPSDRLGTWLQAWRRPGTSAADVRTLLAIWLATVPLAIAGNALANSDASLYFWSQLHGRLLAIIRPGLMLLAALYLVDRSLMVARRARVWPGVAACAIALAPALWLARDYVASPVDRLRTELEAIDRRVGPTIDWTAIGSRPEAEIYYSLARELDGSPTPDRQLPVDERRR